MTGIAGIVQTVPVLFCGGWGRVGGGEGMVRMRNQQSVHKEARDKCSFAKIEGMERAGGAKGG